MNIRNQIFSNIIKQEYPDYAVIRSRQLAGLDVPTKTIKGESMTIKVKFKLDEDSKQIKWYDIES